MTSSSGSERAVRIGALDSLDVVRVDEEGIRELVRGPGELTQHQHAVVGVPAGDELLGDEVHAVSDRGDEHDVGRLIQRRDLGRFERLVDVVDRGRPDLREVAVDLAHELLDAASLVAIGADAIAARARNLYQHGVGHREPAFGEQLAERVKSLLDALRVVEPIDAQQHRTRVAQLLS